MKNTFNLKQFLIITIITSIWIHIAEIARTLFVAFHKMESFYAGKFGIIGPNNFQLSHALIWGALDVIISGILVFLTWLCVTVFGKNHKSIIIASTVTAFATIEVFWIATVNFGLGEWKSAFIIFPIALAELIIGAHIASKFYSKNFAY